jgi:hypothetical protein
VQLQRIFRASEHAFKAGAFHEHCDGTEDTLTLVRTEFGKTIAGYSHYKWNAANSNWVHSENKKTFLLSFDKAEKYVPQDRQYLIYCDPGYGPTFGGGHDLVLHGGCNASSQSYADFPSSYNRENSSKIVNCQQSWTNFSGATDRNNFRVVEYEVFRVRFL